MNKVSEKKLKANQDNAKLGGVKTEKGKEISKFNALKHGILSESITDYENCDYDKLYSVLLRDFPPRNILEELIIERIAVAYIKLLRVSKAEAEHVKTALNDPNEIDGFILNPDGYKSEFSVEHFASLVQIYSRYETSAENRFYKALNKLYEMRSRQYEQT